MDAPVLGASEAYTGPNRWQVSTSWRYQKSHRHFVGSEEQHEREEDGSEVVNHIHLLDLGIRYNASERTSFSLGIPYLMAERSNPIRNSSGVVIARTETQARGMGDITVVARRLLWKPKESPTANVSFGLGLKLPTGANNVVDTRQRLVNGQIVNSVETVDQSIQPGDGGFGAVLEVQGFRRLPNCGFSLYGSAAYLVNPEGQSGVATFRGGSGEQYMSIADQYLARVGVTYTSPGLKGWGFALGGRLEGVPVRDLIGSSDGFRRPGYAVSVEPGISYTRGPHSVSLAVPIAVYRNRTRSVPDREAVPSRHGDAAFADYVWFLGYFRKF